MTAYRVAIANVPPAEIAKALRAAGFSGTVQPQCIGFTAEWGEEPSTVVEVATDRHHDFAHAIAAILRTHGELCAYITANGANPRLLFAHSVSTSPIPTDAIEAQS